MFLYDYENKLFMFHLFQNVFLGLWLREENISDLFNYQCVNLTLKISQLNILHHYCTYLSSPTEEKQRLHMLLKKIPIFMCPYYFIHLPKSYYKWKYKG